MQLRLVFIVFVFILVVSFCFVYAADRESEIGDRKLEAWSLGNLEDCRLFCKLYMVLTSALGFYKNAMLYQRFCMFFIRF